MFRLGVRAASLMSAAFGWSTNLAAQTFSEFTIPTDSSAPSGITTVSDSALWFAEFGGNKIGRITTAGVIMEFPTPTAGSVPVGITTGPDGALTK
jgi:virginiamycin B lyase